MLIPLLLLLLPVQAQITVYNNTLPNPTALVPAASMDFAAQIRLVPPAPPQPPFTLLDLVIPADPNAAGYPLSIPQRGNFLGFSIELSVATNLLGDAPGNMRPNFLNYMANIQRRAGRGPLVRVGGNTQDSSTLFVKGLPDGASVNKIKGQSVANAGDSKTIQVTPIINYSLDLLYTMSNITALVGAEWYFGLAFNESDPSPNIALVAEWSSRILGDSLKGLALGNEPDLYAVHGDRDESYNLGDYLDEFERARDTVVKKNSLPEKQILLGPAVCCAMPGFGIQDVLASPWLQDNIDYLKAVTVQRYPNNNCQLDGVVRDPQALFPDYLNHTSAQVLTLPYLEASATAQAAGKEMLMMEMNTASCGGFPGISDSFGAAMWIADWAFQLAWGNFSASLMHVGGQGVYYNVSSWGALTPAIHPAAMDKGVCAMDDRVDLLFLPRCGRGVRVLWQRSDHRPPPHPAGRAPPNVRGLRERRCCPRRALQLCLRPVRRVDVHRECPLQFGVSLRALPPRRQRRRAVGHHMGRADDERELRLGRQDVRADRDASGCLCGWPVCCYCPSTLYRPRLPHRGRAESVTA